MKATPLDYTLEYLSYRGVRTSGIHLTDCLNYIETHILKKKQGDFTGWELAAPLGFAWEDLVFNSLRAQGREIVSGVELQSDGIIMSPDGLEFDPFQVWETKLKFASLYNDPPLENWRWLYQIKSYCRAIGTTQAVLAACYINGTGRPPVPQRAFYTLEFTQRELDETWRAVLQARDMLLRGEGA